MRFWDRKGRPLESLLQTLENQRERLELDQSELQEVRERAVREAKVPARANRHVARQRGPGLSPPPPNAADEMLQKYLATGQRTQAHRDDG